MKIILLVATSPAIHTGDTIIYQLAINLSNLPNWLRYFDNTLKFSNPSFHSINSSWVLFTSHQFS
jgi:hypothetical protein